MRTKTKTTKTIKIIPKFELIQAEVRLYYAGRRDWDTEFFEGTCGMDIQNKAAEIAKRLRADHFSFGRATTEEEYQHKGPRTLPRISSNPKDQVEAIKGTLGSKAEFYNQ